MRIFDDLPHPARPPRWLLPVAIPLLVAMVAANQVGQAMIAQWAERHPAWLFALNARSTIALLVTNQLDAFSYYTIGLGRLLSSDPILFAIGYFYGDEVLRWTEKKMGQDAYRGLAWWEKAFHAARWPMVAFAPNNIICLLAGASRMALVPFLVLNIAGSFVRLWAMRAFGDIFSGPVSQVTGFLTRWRWPLTAVLVGILVLQWWLSRNQGGLVGDVRDIAVADGATCTETEPGDGATATAPDPTPERNDA